MRCRRRFPSRAGRGKRGLRAALAQERAAGLGRLAAEAARLLGCGDAGLEAAEAVIRAGLLRLGGSVLEQLLAADPGHRGPRVPCGQGHEAVERAIAHLKTWRMLSEEGGRFRPPIEKFEETLQAITGLMFLTAYE